MNDNKEIICFYGKKGYGRNYKLHSSINKPKYVLVDIGCIECGELSDVLGIFNNLSEAELIKNKCINIQRNNWIGQHEFLIFKVEKEDELINKYYKNKLKECEKDENTN